MMNMMKGLNAPAGDEIVTIVENVKSSEVMKNMNGWLILTINSVTRPVNLNY